MAEKSKARSQSRLMTPLGWVLGALSVMNLLKDLTPMKIYGLLGDWLQAYASFVAAIAEPLFGWIHWRWISVSANDAHVIVLTVVFCSALTRASAEAQIEDGSSWDSAMVGGCAGSFVTVGLPVFVLTILLPQPLDAIVAGVVLLILAIFFGIAFKEKDGSVPAASVVRRELVGVASIVLLLVAINYAVFK